MQPRRRAILVFSQAWYIGGFHASSRWTVLAIKVFINQFETEVLSPNAGVGAQG